MAPHDPDISAVSRERLRSGAFKVMLREAERRGLLKIASDQERRHSREQILSQANPGADVWVFGYGSLMWNPAFQYADRCITTLHGYHRRFCLWTHAGRASVESPGLILALEPGGSCRGEAFRIPGRQAESELDVIWAREMVAMSYRPSWVTLHGQSGPFRAITFVSNRAEQRYAGRLPADQVAATLARASGPLGTARDYLERTVAHLQELGLSDRHLNELLSEIRRNDD